MGPSQEACRSGSTLLSKERHAWIQRGAQGVGRTPGKPQVIRVSIGNKQLDPEVGHPSDRTKIPGSALEKLEKYSIVSMFGKLECMLVCLPFFYVTICTRVE